MSLDHFIKALVLLCKLRLTGNENPLQFPDYLNNFLQAILQESTSVQQQKKKSVPDFDK